MPGHPSSPEKSSLSKWTRVIPPFHAALNRVPAKCRPTLFYETFYNVGAGAFMGLFGLSLAALKSDQIFSPAGSKEHLMFVAAMFGGSCLLSPLVGYVGSKVPMRWLVIWPSAVLAMLLFSIGFLPGATFFALFVGVAFVIQVFPRVAEMNMFRVLYPPTHRGAAVGWVKAIANISGLLATVLGTFWFLWKPERYYWAYWATGTALAISAIFYARIPVRGKNEFGESKAVLPHRAFVRGLKVFVAHRRFVLYQIGFWFAGFGNHMSHAYIAESLKEDIQASDRSIFWIVAVLPPLVMSMSAPVWGRYLDRVNPMTGRAVFNVIQSIGYTFHFYGGVSRQIWPFVIGAIIHAIANGGGAINWLTGSLYFAKQENVPLYNSIHVGLTGIRGLLAPIMGVWVYGATFSLGAWTVPGLGMGPGLFMISAGLSLCGCIFMSWMSRNDTGPADDG